MGGAEGFQSLAAGGTSLSIGDEQQDFSRHDGHGDVVDVLLRLWAADSR